MCFDIITLSLEQMNTSRMRRILERIQEFIMNLYWLTSKTKVHKITEVLQRLRKFGMENVWAELLVTSTRALKFASNFINWGWFNRISERKYCISEEIELPKSMNKKTENNFCQPHFLNSSFYLPLITNIPGHKVSVQDHK